MTKSTSKRVRCVSCGVDYPAKKGHVCDLTKIRTGNSQSQPQPFKSRKMMFGSKSR